jgi:biopolymer transport protein ExbD
MMRRPASENVELNVTAMLDMAFQLLAFFVLTFRPAPAEWGFRMHLPPAQAVTVDPGPLQPSAEPNLATANLASVKTLRVDLFSASGALDSIRVNDVPVSLDELRQKLYDAIQTPRSTIEQVVVQAGDRLHYATLMRVVGMCADHERADTAEGKQFVKLRLVAMGDGDGR